MTSLETASPAGPQRILVTGATGFIGSHTVPVLRGAGHEVAVLVRSGSSAEFEEGVEVLTDDGDTARLEATLAGWQPTVCLHLATKYVNVASADDVVPLAESNVTFGMRVAHAFAKAGGSAFVYTSTFSQRRNGEDFNPTNLYASTKQALTDVLKFYAATDAFKVLDIQLFDSFGTGDPRPKIWNLLMNAVASGEALATTKGEQLLSPTHAHDVARAMTVASELAATQQDSWSNYYLPGPKVLPLKDAVALFERVNNIEIPVIWGARDYTGNEMFDLWQSGDVLPGWEPTISLEEGFVQMWNEFSKNSQ